MDGETVLYGSASELQATLEYDLIFGEGNTRTTAVFFIKYLRTLGFEVENTIFAENAWYFRNSLVRANYNDIKNGVHETTEFLELFLKNLLLNEQNALHNRSMHIRGIFQEHQKPDIQHQKPDIEVLAIYQNKLNQFTNKTITHTQKLFFHFGKNHVFGRTNAISILGLSPSRTSELLGKLLEAGVIESAYAAMENIYNCAKRNGVKKIMKSARKWNYLQLLLAIVVAFSGICTYSTDTYSLFCRTRNAAQHTIVQSLEGTQLQPDVCGSEQLETLNMRGMLRQIAQKSRLGTRSIRQRSSSKCAFSTLTGWISSGYSHCQFSNTWMYHCDDFVRSTRLIIEYIHRQDGSKG